MRLSLRPTTCRRELHDEAGIGITSCVVTKLNPPTYASLPDPKPSWSLASFALRALAGSLDILDLEFEDAPSLGLNPREDVLDDLLDTDDDGREEDPRVWSALSLAYGPAVNCVRTMPLSDPHLFLLPQPVVLDLSALAAFDDDCALSLLAFDLRALVVLDVSGQTRLTDHGLRTLARAKGTRGVRALALRGCSAISAEGVAACAMAWDKLEVIDVRGTRCPKGIRIPGFAPHPPALLADTLFSPRTAEQAARALLGKDTPFVLVEEEDFRPTRPRAPKRRRLNDDKSMTLDEDLLMVNTSSYGFLAITTPAPPSTVPFDPRPRSPELATAQLAPLPEQPPTLQELRARRFTAFGATPAAQPDNQPIPTPPPPPIRAPESVAPSSAWTRASAVAPAWGSLLARHRPLQPYPVVHPIPTPPPHSIPLNSGQPHKSKRRPNNPLAPPSASTKRRGASTDDTNAAAERARFVQRLTDDDALMFVRDPASAASLPVEPTKEPVQQSSQSAVKKDKRVKAHLSAILQSRTGASVAVPPAIQVVRAEANKASCAKKRQVPFGKASAEKKGLSTWFGEGGDDDDYDDDGVVEVSRAPQKEASAAKATKPPLLAMPPSIAPILPAKKPMVPALNPPRQPARTPRQTTLSFTKNPGPSSTGKH